MIIERIRAMPSRWTFTIPPIKRLLAEEGAGIGDWVDPFAGQHSPAAITNDLNPAASALHHEDALLFCRHLLSNSADGVLFDPPYSITQAKECYDSFGLEKPAINVSSMAYWAGVKDELARILRPGGKAICCGWSSMGLGKSRGFTMTRILLVPHGGSKNDTIVTVEVKA